MREQYRAVRQAINRSMRRWWLRVGSWWIAALVVLLPARIIASLVSDLPVLINFNLQYVPVYFLGRMQRFAIPVALALWIFAALQVRQLINDLTKSIPVNKQEQRAISFLLMLGQGVIPLAALFISIGNSGYMTEMLIAIFLIALLASNRIPTWFILLWLLRPVVSLIAGFLFDLDTLNYIAYPGADQRDIIGVHASLMMIVGCLSYYLLLVWAIKGKSRLALWLGSAWLGILLLSMLRLGTNSYAPSYLLQSLRFSEQGLNLGVAVYYINHESLVFWLLRYPVAITVGTWALYLVPILNIAFIAIHVIAFTWLLLNTVSVSDE